MMDQDRYAQIDQLFKAVLECESGQRAAFLDEACTGDQELRCRVEKLIEAHSHSTGFLASPAINIFFEPANSRESMIGKRIGNFEIQRKLGEGGMGVVYLARDLRLGRFAALKILSPKHDDDELNRSKHDDDELKRFELEAIAAASLNHENIATIYERGEAEGYHYIASEFIEGQTLETYRSTNGRMPPQQAIDVAIQIARGLEAAHQAGIVHRDIKPQNIMLRQDGRAKILDFGIVKLLEHHQKRDPITKKGMILGTLKYMSPEQVSGREIDVRTDIFSFGVVLYELVTGTLLFSQRTPDAVVISILGMEPSPIHRFAPDAPEWLQQIISKALCKERDHRYQTCKDLLCELDEGKRSLDDFTKLGPPPARVAAEAEAAAIALAEDERKKRRSRLGRVAMLLFLALIVTVFAVMYSQNPLWFRQPSNAVNQRSPVLGGSPSQPPLPRFDSGQPPPPEVAKKLPPQPEKPTAPGSVIKEERFKELLRDARNSQALGQFGKACEKYQEALKALPASHGKIGWGSINEGKASLSRNEYKEAAEQFRRAFQSIPVE